MTVDINMCVFQINMRQIGFIAMRISVGRFIYLFIRIQKKKFSAYVCECVLTIISLILDDWSHTHTAKLESAAHFIFYIVAMCVYLRVDYIR